MNNIRNEKRVEGRPRLCEALPIGTGVLHGRRRVDQVQYLLRPVEDAHAKPSDHLGAAGPGVHGDVAPAEAVRGPAVSLARVAATS